MVRLIAHWRNHAGFSFVEETDTIPPQEVCNADGTTTIFYRRYIILPSDSSTWNDDLLDGVYTELASIALDDYHELIRPIVFSLTVTKNDFGSYCDRAKWPRPPFWFRHEQRSERAKRQEQEVADWLRSLSMGQKMGSKKAYFAEARKQFPGVPYNAFERAWDKSVPLKWKQVGALPKPKKGFD
jgi:hypothetical protein